MIHQWLAPLTEKESLEFLQNLKQRNIDFAEIKLVCSKWDKRIIQIREILKRGLDVTIHTGFEGDYNIALFTPDSKNITYQEYFKIFEKCNLIASEKGSACIVNFHGATETPEISDFRALMKRTVEFTKWAFEVIVQKNWQVKLAVELLPQTSTSKHVLEGKVGLLPQELLELWQKVGEKELRFCWDLGHYQINLNNGLDIKPDLEFLEKVTHVHLHDLCDGTDHLPLKFGGVPYKDYLGFLSGNKEDIKVVLELDYTLTSNCGKAYNLLFESLEKVKGDLAILNS